MLLAVVHQSISPWGEKYDSNFRPRLCNVL
jgi:hypothetical protein